MKIAFIVLVWAAFMATLSALVLIDLFAEIKVAM